MNIMITKLLVFIVAILIVSVVIIIPLFIIGVSSYHANSTSCYSCDNKADSCITCKKYSKYKQMSFWKYINKG